MTSKMHLYYLLTASGARSRCTNLSLWISRLMNIEVKEKHCTVGNFPFCFGSARFCKSLQKFLRFLKIFKYLPRLQKFSKKNSIFSKLFQDFPGFSKIFQDFPWISRLMNIEVKENHCTVGNFPIFFASSRFCKIFQIFQDFLRHGLICKALQDFRWPLKTLICLQRLCYAWIWKDSNSLR